MVPQKLGGSREEEHGAGIAERQGRTGAIKENFCQMAAWWAMWLVLSVGKSADKLWIIIDLKCAFSNPTHLSNIGSSNLTVSHISVCLVQPKLPRCIALGKDLGLHATKLRGSI